MCCTASFQFEAVQLFWTYNVDPRDCSRGTVVVIEVFCSISLNTTAIHVYANQAEALSIRKTRGNIFGFA
jgi:hypothetical protein